MLCIARHTWSLVKALSWKVSPFWYTFSFISCKQLLHPERDLKKWSFNVPGLTWHIVGVFLTPICPNVIKATFQTLYALLRSLMGLSTSLRNKGDLGVFISHVFNGAYWLNTKNRRYNTKDQSEKFKTLLEQICINRCVAIDKKCLQLKDIRLWVPQLIYISIMRTNISCPILSYPIMDISVWLPPF